MKRIFLCLTVLAITTIVEVLSSLYSFAQDNPALLPGEREQKSCSRGCTASHQLSSNSFVQRQIGYKGTSALTAVPASRGYDVLRYDLVMDWTNPLKTTSESGSDRFFTGVQTITLRLDSGITLLPLHATQMRIDSAFVNGTRSQLANPRITDNETVYIPLPTSVCKNDTMRIRLYYTYIGAGNDNDGTGFLLYRKGRLGAVRTGNDSVFIPERLAYTMSQPYGARRWMPCNDVPNDKALTSIAVRVPQGFQAVSNGLLQERRKDSLGGETFFWTHRFPVPPYLMAVSASIFSTYTEFYKKASNPNDSIPVDHWFWKEDDNTLPLNNKNYTVRKSVNITVGTMEAYSRWFGEYPFERYGHVVLQPFFAGGMEHQTISSINRAWLRGSSPAGIAHEIMHQWFGDKVTCASWEDIWLNEGMATYGEALWYESWGGRDWNMVAMKGFRTNYFASNTRFQSVYITSPTNDDVIFNYATTYAKGGWIHHTLRRIYGDSVYFPAMRLFATRFAFGAAFTRDLQQVFEETARQRLAQVLVPVATVFQEWVYGSGNPIYGGAWRIIPIPSAGSQTTRITFSLAQLQTGMNIPEVFHLPVEITFLKFIQTASQRDTQRVVRTITMNNRREQATFDLPFQPDSVVIDEADNILCEKISLPTLSAEQQVSLNVYPQPLRIGETLSADISLRNAGNITVDVVNVLGQRVAMLYDGFASEGAQIIREALNIPTGAYFLRLQSGGNTSVQKILVTY